jgi:hypothetical protein
LPAFASQRNIVLLTLLGAAAEQDNDPFSVFSEVNPVAWAEIDAAFKDPAADSLYIREISQSQTIKGRCYPARCLGI